VAGARLAVTYDLRGRFGNGWINMVFWSRASISSAFLPEKEAIIPYNQNVTSIGVAFS
jgi:hypothetical protein